MIKRSSVISVLLLVGVVVCFGIYYYLLSIPEEKMTIISPSYNEGSVIPERFTCKGENISPTLAISNVPKGTQSLALVFEDPDAPFWSWYHWLLWNISPDTIVIAENSIPVGSVQGSTSFGVPRYAGPCITSDSHRYSFRLFALDTTLTLPPEAKYEDLFSVMNGHILAESSYLGVFPSQ